MLFGRIKENNAKKEGNQYRIKGLDINGDKAYATIPKSRGTKSKKLDTQVKKSCKR